MCTFHAATARASSQCYSPSLHKTPASSLSKMAASLPGDIKSIPDQRLIFNGPFDAPVTVTARISNGGGKKAGWAVKTTNMKRFAVDPPCGVLDPKQSTLLSVTCQPFDIGGEDISNDRITIEWTDAPAGAGAKFQREWFQGSGVIRRKVINCDYNV